MMKKHDGVPKASLSSSSRSPITAAHAIESAQRPARQPMGGIPGLEESQPGAS